MPKYWHSTLLLVGLTVVPALLPLVLCADWLRWSGALYQIAGLITVLWGINERPSAFGLPPALSDTLQKVRRLFRGQHVVLTVGEAVASSEVIGRAHVKVSGTTEQRLDRLEDELYRLGCELDDKLRKLDKDVRQRINEDAAKWQAAITKLEGQVKEATLGNRYIEALGVAFFFIGTLLSAWA
jgi:hypothetical protein